MRFLKVEGRAFINAMLAVMMAALYILVSTPVAKSAMSELYNSPIYRGHMQGKVGIECAVSWNASALSDMLDILDERDVRITFFVSGEWAKENKALLTRMVRSGHEIGTMGHAPAQDGDSKTVLADLEEALRTIHEACGIRPKMYYSGTRSMKNSTEAARKLGLLHVLCTADLLSGRGEAEDILLRALDKPFDGSILLIQPTAEAVKALPAVLDGLNQLGLRAGTVGETLGEYNKKEVRV